LWDMHVHLRSDRKTPSIRLVEENAALLDLFLPNGIVGIREMGGDLADEVVQWREEIRSGKRTGPRILTAGRKIDQEPPMWSGSLGVNTPAEAREAVRQVKQSGADFVKTYFGKVSPEVLGAVIDEAHKVNLKLTGHKPVNMSIQQFVESGIDGMELATEVAKTDPLPQVQFAVIEALQFRSCDRLVKEMLKTAPPAVWSLLAQKGYAREIRDPEAAARLRE